MDLTEIPRYIGTALELSSPEARKCMCNTRIFTSALSHYNVCTHARTHACAHSITSLCHCSDNHVTREGTTRWTLDT